MWQEGTLIFKCYSQMMLGALSRSKSSYLACFQRTTLLTVTRGAVLSQLEREATVTSTSFTRHYGVQAWEPIDPIADIDQPTKIGRDGTTRVKKALLKCCSHYLQLLANNNHR